MLRKLFLTALILWSTGLAAMGASPRPLSERVARSFIDRFPDPDVIHWQGETNHFSWQAGYLMLAMEQLWRQTNDSCYLDYVRRYVDQNVDAQGRMPGFSPDALDNYAPGTAVLLLYELTGDDRYRRAVRTLRDSLRSYPRMAGGMFQHARHIPQVWVDGVFMGQRFLARYARDLGDRSDFEEVVRQLEGIFSLCGTPEGLLYHGWDGQRHTPEVWSEGMGWVAVLLADVFDFLPVDLEGRDRLLDRLVRMCRALKDCQDPQTGLWCQVVDKPTVPGNWNETSGSGMFLYLLQKAILKGYIPAEEFQSVVDRAYEGLCRKVVCNADGFCNLVDCSSIGLQSDYASYISQPREINTFAAFGSFILGTGLVEHTLGHAFPQTFYATDYTQGRVFRLERGRVVWQHEAPLSNDLWALPDGHLLFTTGKGVLELDSRGDTVFCYQSRSHVFACQRLADGNTFVGECESGRLLEVSPRGRVVRQVCILPKGVSDGGMAFMRNARKLPNGHYLVAHYGAGRVSEYDRRGRQVWTVEAAGGPHSVVRLDNGHTLVAIADANGQPRVVEYAADGSVAWQLTNDDLPGRPLRFLSGLHYVEGQGLFLTNWQGHLGQATEPHLLWVTRDKRVVAVLPPQPAIETLSSVFVPGAGNAH